MKQINYVTGNQIKLEYVRSRLKPYDIHVVQKVLDIQEIQSNVKSEIALDKAKKAYEILKEPLFVTDTFWEIEAVNGFPGAYMKYVNDWFSADHFINLMKGEKNRKAKSTDTICYVDENGIQVFTEQFIGEVAEEKYSGEKKLKNSTGWDHVFKCNGKYLGEHHEDFGNFRNGEDLWKKFSKIV